MRSVRCDRCGVKALIAASQCPKCAHLFEVRDGFGEMLPLAYCSSCDSYYPEQVGSCKWCGTKPEREPMAPKVWKGAGVAALVALAFVAWLAHSSGPNEPLDARSKMAALEPDAMSVPAESIASNLGSTSAASRPASSSELAAVAADSGPSRTTVASSGSIDRDSVATPVTPTGEPSAPRDSIAQKSSRVVVAATESAKPQAKLSAAKPDVSKPSSSKASASSGRSSRAARWVSTVSKNWVIVRADASPGARIVASIGPNSRVQLGEYRGSWRRIRTKGIAGWVDQKAFFSRAPRKLAAR